MSKTKKVLQYLRMTIYEMRIMNLPENGKLLYKFVQ